MDRGSGRGGAVRRSAYGLVGVAVALVAGWANALPNTSQGTWYGTDGSDGTLRGRDAMGSPVSLLVGALPNPALKYVYDTVLDVTWLANWNQSGPMNWYSAVDWAAGLRDFGGGWALPSVADLGVPGCDTNDCGIDLYGSEIARRGSPLAHMYYDTLGNISLFTEAYGTVQKAGGGLTNKGPFQGMQMDIYWSNTPVAGGSFYGNGAFHFDMLTGEQFVWAGGARNLHFAVAIRAGDVAPIPEPGTYAMFGLGLVGVGFAMGWRRVLYVPPGGISVAA